ncbi:MAG: hypothetical protein ACJ77O_09775 [Chloroflexota bacterium]
MTKSPDGGFLSWEPSPKSGPPTDSPRQPPYWRSIGWAIVAWVVAAAAVYLVGEVLRFREVAGWAALVGVVVGGRFGGTRGGITGRRQWMIFALMLSAILVLAIGLGSCAYAMALYG